MVSEYLDITKLVNFSVMVAEHLSLHFYNFFVICYAFFKFTATLWKMGMVSKDLGVTKLVDFSVMVL